jgi:hypothetical protein
MKKVINVYLALCVSLPSFSQIQESEQLSLNLQKLVQMKSMLSSMYNGYNIIKNGYNDISSIAKGNFNLHKNYFDGLLAVSPSVLKYRKIASIVSNQALIVKEYKEAHNRFRASGLFRVDEVLSMGIHYASLTEQAGRNIDELLLVVTPGRLRMSDAERLKSIDRIDGTVMQELEALRKYNCEQSVIAQQRRRVKNDIEVLKKVYGVK